MRRAYVSLSGKTNTAPCPSTHKEQTGALVQDKHAATLFSVGRSERAIQAGAGEDKGRRHPPLSSSRVESSRAEPSRPRTCMARE